MFALIDYDSTGKEDLLCMKEKLKPKYFITFLSCKSMLNIIGRKIQKLKVQLHLSYESFLTTYLFIIGHLL